MTVSKNWDYQQGQKMGKENFENNYAHNIMRTFNILKFFSFTASEWKSDYY